MKCYDCGGEIASGTGTCPSCGCPAGRDEAAECLGARLLTAQLESESALDQLGKARSAMFAAALLALASGVVELVNAQGNGVRLMVGIVMLVLAGGYVAIGCNVRKSPLVLSVAGLVVSAFFLSGVFGVVIAGVMALSVWFAVLYTKAALEERGEAEAPPCREGDMPGGAGVRGVARRMAGVCSKRAVRFPRPPTARRDGAGEERVAARSSRRGVCVNAC